MSTTVTFFNTCGHSILPGDKLFVVNNRVGVQYTEGRLPETAKVLGYSTRFTKPGEPIECCEEKYNDSFCASLLPTVKGEQDKVQSHARVKKQNQKQRRRQEIEDHSWRCTGSVDMTRTMYYMKQVCRRIDHAEKIRILQHNHNKPLVTTVANATHA